MKRLLRRTTALLMAICCLIALAGCQQQTAEEKKYEEEKLVIGVAVYNPDTAEMEMFMNYYRDYIAEGFPVEFYFSDQLTSTEDEQAFIRSVKEQGAKGVISFYGTDLKPVVDTCEEVGLYYVLASGTVSDDAFNSVCENPWFLGTIGPSSDAEVQAGSDMASYFWNLDARRFLILSGGASVGNYMHFARVQGMLDTLAELGGFTYDRFTADLAVTDTVTTIQAGDVELTFAPGYFSQDAGQANVKNALANGDYDAILCAYNIDTVLPDIVARETELGHSLRAGTVDVFSAQNFDIIKQKDAFGNVQIDYIAGKYASMAGPAFAALYNAIQGDLDVVRPEGKAFRLYQGFWSATSPEEFMELYGYTTGIYENAYSCADLMQVIRAYHDEADFDAFQALTEAYDVASVKARILGQ